MVINFVSISGISNRDQLVGIKKISLEEKINFPITIGYQVSSMSINKGTQNPRQPKFCELVDLDKRTRDYGFITAVHYYTKDNDTILKDMQAVIDSGISSNSLVQFNSLPPTPAILEKVKKMGFKIILKVAVADKSSPEGGYKVWKGEGVEDVLTGNPLPLFNQVYDRREFLEYAMFDPSHGNKVELDLGQESLAIKFGKMVMNNSALDNMGLIYAGGIKPTNVQRVAQELKSFFPNRFSIDIEGGVRVDDKFDLGLVRDYLRGYKETSQ